MVYRNFVLSFLLMCVFLVPVEGLTAEEGASTVDPKLKLESQLKGVNQEIADLNTSLQDLSVKLWNSQRELSYTDPEIAKYYKAIKDLERNLLAARKQLDLHLSLHPEYQGIETQRKQVFRELAGRKAVKDSLIQEMARFR